MTEQTPSPDKKPLPDFGPWGDRSGKPETQMQIIGAENMPPELVAKLEEFMLRRVKEMNRTTRYDGDEAGDVSRAAGDAAVAYLESTAPDADFLIITSVPYTVNESTVGNALTQRFSGGPLFTASLNRDIIPRLARGAYGGGIRGRLTMAWKVLFGKDGDSTNPNKG